jgi:hypothetical protein
MLAFLNIIIAAIISVQTAINNKIAGSRYLLAALPFLSLTAGFCVDWFCRWQRGK